MRQQLESALARGEDGPALRLALGSRCLAEGDTEAAVEHLQAAVAQDVDYSAAWKTLGQALAQAGRVAEAEASYRQGIEVAERRGDRQAAKEMAVFLKRLRPRGSTEE
jgi:Flp pilus assembly protein TadD